MKVRLKANLRQVIALILLILPILITPPKHNVLIDGCLNFGHTEALVSGQSVYDWRAGLVTQHFDKLRWYLILLDDDLNGTHLAKQSPQGCEADVIRELS